MFFRSRLGADSCGQQRISVRMIEQLCTKCQLFVLRCAKKGAPSSCALFFGEEYRCISRQDGIIAHGALAAAEASFYLLCCVTIGRVSHIEIDCAAARNSIQTQWPDLVYQLVGIPTIELD